MTELLIALNYAEVLVCCVIIMAAFFEMPLKARNAVPLLLMCAASLAVQAAVANYIGMDFCYKIYPLIAQFPFVLLFVYYFKKPWAFSFFAMFCSYLFTIPRMWTGLAANALFGGGDNFYYLTQIIATIPLLWIICKYVAPNFVKYYNLPRRELYFIGLLPATYYFFSYASTVYSDWLFSAGRISVELMVTFSIAFYFCFTVIYINRIKHSEKLKTKNELINTQNAAARTQLEQINYSQQTTKALRHDMRHHLQIIDSYIASGNSAEAQEYIRQVEAVIESTIITEYCKNRAVNLILSSWDGKAKKHKVSMDISAQIPEICPISELDICIVLSNAIENAVNAASMTEDAAKQTVKIQCKADEKKFYLLVENHFKTAPIFSDGLPVSNENGHGTGTKSIVAVVQKHKGVYSFSVKEDLFILRVVL